MRLKELYEKYRDRVEFIIVYVKEAHASDRWWLGRSRTQRLVHELSGDLARIDVDEPVTLEQRRRVAASCQANLFDGVVPLYVDPMDNRVASLYTARPTRIFQPGPPGAGHRGISVPGLNELPGGAARAAIANRAAPAQTG